MFAYLAAWVLISVPIAMIAGSAIAFGMGGDEYLPATARIPVAARIPPKGS